MLCFLAYTYVARKNQALELTDRLLNSWLPGWLASWLTAAQSKAFKSNRYHIYKFE